MVRAVKVATTLVIASLFMIAAGSVSADGDGSFKDSGIILAGSPVAIQEQTFPCDPSAPDNGINGVWYDVSDYQDADFLVEVSDTLDIDPLFYDIGCSFIGNGGAPLDFLGGDEDGTVPSNAHYLLVWGWAGAGPYTLTIE